ncbi:MAG: hypothetical protein LKE54_03690 [Prevotella sp.]|jgi:hypothetical protein|nr:hypothetical protein [Prevotella sp.]MCH3994149.1 hypothetical protein [Prevotella sp.]
MATIIKQPTNLSFSSTIDDLVLKTDAEMVDLVVDITHGTTTEVLLSETYYPDEDGNVTLSQIGDLVEPWVRKYGSVTMQISVSEHIGNGKDVTAPDYSETIKNSAIDIGTILFAAVDPQVSAEWFCSHHFLTILEGEKLTSMIRTECLSAYDASTLAVTATLHNITDNTFQELNGTLTPANTSGMVYDYNVSPKNIFDLVGGTSDYVLTSYVCTAGERTQSYRVIEDQIPPAPALVFLNSFGCWEYLYCTGTHSKDSKYTRSTAVIGGLRRNYNIEEDRQFKALTGWLNEAMADWADDLFRSQHVYLYTGGKMGKEIVITDSKSEISNEDDNLPVFEFTWGYAQKQHNVMDAEKLRIFDSTFDYTFN